MKRKKVFVDLFYLNTALSGIKTYMLEFCEALNNQPSQEMEYIFSHPYQRISSDSFFRGNIPYWKKIGYHIYYFFWKQILLPFRVKSSGADTLLCFDFIAPAIPLKVHKLVVVHDAFFWQMPQNYNKLWRKYFIPMILAGLKGHSTVITTSEYSKKALQKHTPIKNPICVIYQCPKLLEGDGDAEIIPQLGLKKKAYFLHVGSFDKRKMIPVLVKAFAQIVQNYPNSFNLVLVGEKGLSTSLDDYENVKDEVRILGLEGRVKLPGFLSDAAVKTLYQGAFAYIFPSSNEGFGIPSLEAMANEIPLIISDQEALMEIVGDAALVHQTGNETSLAEKMHLLIENPELRKELIEKGKLRQKMFDRSAFIQAFEALVRQPPNE
jgi:glycosyltransferase involved in cell wall biosynthesis